MTYWNGVVWGTDPERKRSDTAARFRGASAIGIAVLLVVAALSPSGGALAATSGLATSPGSGPAGLKINVIGTNFAFKTKFQLTWDGSSEGMPIVTTNIRGNFSTWLNVPGNAPSGAHAFGAMTTTTLSRRKVATADVLLVSTTFMVTSEAASPTASATPTATASPPASPSPTPSPSPTATPATYVFNDEFNGSSLGAVWGTASHWGTAPEYVNDRSMLSVGNGHLTIKATKIAGVWHTAELDTFSRWSRAYGYFEARMRFTAGDGLWPAFWLAHDWTGDKSELDIFEGLANPYTGKCGNNSGGYFATVHMADGSSPDGTRHYCATEDLAGSWHDYGMDWRADGVTFYLDGNPWYTYKGYVPSSTMPIIFNLALGGWAGPATSNTPDPSYLEVDWVRVSP